MKHAALSELQPAPRSTRKSCRPPIPGNLSRNGKRSPSISRQLTRLDKMFIGLLGVGQGPSIAFIYQDDETRGWAKETSERLARLAGDEGMRASWWRISDLTAPGILAGAVSSALQADMIVVASRAEGLPFPFYVWVNLWWPNRAECPGALVALVGPPERAASREGRVGDYLRIVARQARMEYLAVEKPVTSSSEKQFPKPNPANGFPSWNGHLHD